MRLMMVVVAAVVGTVAGFLLGGGDLQTLLRVLDDPALLQAMSDAELVGMFLPAAIGGIAVAWATNRWIEHRPD